MQHTVSLELYSYWIQLKRGRFAPQRCEIEPSGISSLLSNTFILETDGLEGTSFRLAGTDTCALFGRDLKGTDFLDLWSDHGRESLVSSLCILRNDVAGIFTTWSGRTERYHETNGELLLLPLMHDGRIKRVLGSFSTFETPYWQGTFPMVSIRLDDIRVILPSQHGLPPYQQVETPIIETKPPVLGQLGRRVRHLTIYEGGQNQA